MKIILIGATGTIGGPVAELLGARHDVVRVGYHDGDHHVDLADRASIEALYDAVGPFDAVVSAAGRGVFGPLADLTDAQFAAVLGNKLMGQVNLVRLGRERIADGGSFTLTGGMLAHRPMRGSAAISMANAGLEGFARAAALELAPEVRVNVVCPVFVKETMVRLGMDPSTGVSAADTALAYREAVDGSRTGEVLHVRDFLG